MTDPVKLIVDFGSVSVAKSKMEGTGLQYR